MRVIEHNAPGHILNQGVVVFHAGANIARRWADFQTYSEADREYFDQLLPLEGVEPGDPRDEREIIPLVPDTLEVRGQSDVSLEEIPLLQDEAAMAALRVLQQRGYSSEDIDAALQILQPVPTTRARERQALRSGLDMRVRTEAARILAERRINPEGHDLDRQRLGRSNLIVMKAAIDRQINLAVQRGASQRHNFSRVELDLIAQRFTSLVATAVDEVFRASN